MKKYCFPIAFSISTGYVIVGCIIIYETKVNIAKQKWYIYKRRLSPRASALVCYFGSEWGNIDLPLHFRMSTRCLFVLCIIVYEIKVIIAKQSVKFINDAFRRGRLLSFATSGLNERKTQLYVRKYCFVIAVFMSTRCAFAGCIAIYETKVNIAIHSGTFINDAFRRGCLQVQMNELTILFCLCFFHVNRICAYTAKRVVYKFSHHLLLCFLWIVIVAGTLRMNLKLQPAESKQRSCPE